MRRRCAPGSIGRSCSCVWRSIIRGTSSAATGGSGRSGRADLNYDQVQAYIDGDAEALPDDQALRESTTVLSEAARMLLAARGRKGSLK